MRRSPLSLLFDLHRLDRDLKRLPCPLCKADQPQQVLSRDRYFLRVDLSICQVCGAIYLARGLTGAAAQRFYRDIYQRLMAAENLSPPALGQARLAAGYRVNAIRNVVGALDDVIDIGAGHGFFLAACRDAGSASFWGIEPGGPQRRYAEDQLELRGRVGGGDFTSPEGAPFQPAIVTLFHVLEHLEDPGATLDTIAGWLPRDGWLVIEVPDLARWSEIGLNYVHVSHRSYFTAATLTGLLTRHGFRVHTVQQELYGIHPTNLRVFARAGGAEPTALAVPDALRLRDEIRRQMQPWRLADGYPRVARRLGKLALAGR
ncbi:class I SAM-dependent methyltransferase [Bradyrhizobium sp. HKCCYLS20291]|uniref:class I SAM-dependent methyltransferase n=1 Tax=Bradyrhizobium sp. HKCCYLS20291 TaxID=3420766 RepID=UPI003EBC783D